MHCINFYCSVAIRLFNGAFIHRLRQGSRIVLFWKYFFLSHQPLCAFSCTMCAEFKCSPFRTKSNTRLKRCHHLHDHCREGSSCLLKAGTLVKMEGEGACLPCATPEANAVVSRHCGNPMRAAGGEGRATLKSYRPPVWITERLLLEAGGGCPNRLGGGAAVPSESSCVSRDCCWAERDSLA